MKLTILNPERRVVAGIDINEATIPTSEGEIQILPDHAAMIGTLNTGSFTIKRADGTVIHGALSTGFFRVEDESLTMMAETLELQDEIDLERAKRAQKKAEDNLNGALDEHAFKKYQLKLQRALIRQQVAGKSGN